MRRLALTASLVVIASTISLAAIPAQAEPSPARHTATPDSPVTVMIELDARTSAQAFSRARSKGRSPRAASVDQAARVAEMADEVSRRLDVSSEVLYTTSVLYSGVAVRTTTSKLRALGNIPGVRAVHPMTPKSLEHAVSVPLTNTPTTWTNPGGTGAGVTVGIIDSGIDYTHADFGGSGAPTDYADAKTAKEAGEPADYEDVSKIAGGYDFVGNAYNASSEDAANWEPQPDANPLDCGGHGTHVAGTVGGYGVKDGDTYSGAYSRATPLADFTVAPGMAPKVTLYALKVFGCEGTTNFVTAALDWAADPNGDGSPADHLDVVNMSLGSTFGSPDDPDSVASQAAVDLGISVVAAAGNSGDLFEVSGSPANAAGVISVASTTTDETAYDAISARINAGPETVYGGLQGQAYPWFSSTGDIAVGLTGTLALWPNTTWGSSTSMGCDETPAGGSLFAPGEVALLLWDETDPSFCGSRTATQNARHAGAGGVLFASAQTLPVSIYGDGFAADEQAQEIPAAIVGSVAANALRTAVVAPSSVTVATDATDIATVRGTITPSRTDGMSTFSSRGITTTGIAKPDVSAPGENILSAHCGAGTGGILYAGTSMASPHVAGLAALTLASHPNWTPVQVKAAIVNNATANVGTEASGTGTRYAPGRAGAGRIDSAATVAARGLMLSDDVKGSVSVSFGVVEALTDTSISRTVTISNLRATSPAVYALSVKDITAVPGAQYSLSPTSVRIAPGGSARVQVTLALTRNSLQHAPDPTLVLEPSGDGMARDWIPTATALIVARPIRSTNGGPMRLPVIAAPRPVSALTAASSIDATIGVDGTATATMSLSGTGLDNTLGGIDYLSEHSLTSFLQLLDSSPRMPDCTDELQEECIPFADGAAADLRYVGFASDDELGYFGIATFGPWRTPVGVADFEVHVDADNDGTADLAIVNSRLLVAGEETDVFQSQTYALPYEGEDPIDSQFINAVNGYTDSAKFDSDVMLLPISLDVLRTFLPDGATTAPIRIGVYANAWGAEVSDSLGFDDEDKPVLRVDAFAPELRVSGIDSPTGNTPSPAVQLQQPGFALTMSAAAPNRMTLLVMHHLNQAGTRAQLVEVTKKHTTTAALSITPSTISTLQRASATVLVTSSGGTPTGRVKILEGATVLATGTLSSGSASITLPKLSAGVHRLVALYTGSSTYLQSTSTTTRLTVTRP